MASVSVAGFPENEFPCKVSLSVTVACQPQATLCETLGSMSYKDSFVT